MNSAAQFVALKKLTGKDIIRIAAKHNHREIQAEIGADSHIDHTRIGLNITLAGAATAAEVAAYAEHLINDSGVGNLRRDAVRGIEIVISLPVVSTINHAAFFSDSLAWVREFFSVPILSAVVHLDETAPHCHVILLPLVNGRMVGSDLVGNRARLKAIQASFHEQVGQRHGLTRPKAPRRLNSATRGKSASMAFTAIVGNPDLLLKADVEKAVIESFGRNPEPLLAALGMAIPTTPNKTGKTFVEIMTKPCKPETTKLNPIGFNRHSNPIGFTPELPEKHQTLCSVGFAPNPPSFSDNSTAPGDTSTGNQDDNDSNTFTRDKDNAPVEYWDSDRGEFRTPPPKPSTVRNAAVKELERGLARLGRHHAHG